MDLNNIRVRVGSFTYAMKLKRLLSRSGIRSRLVKTVDVNNTAGCVHGLEISRADFLSSVMIMRESGIDYSIIE